MRVCVCVCGGGEGIMRYGVHTYVRNKLEMLIRHYRNEQIRGLRIGMAWE